MGNGATGGEAILATAAADPPYVCHPLEAPASQGMLPATWVAFLGCMRARSSLSPTQMTEMLRAYCLHTRFCSLPCSKDCESLYEQRHQSEDPEVEEHRLPVQRNRS
eukprot:6457442-Amphidinium_carterae.1